MNYGFNVTELLTYSATFNKRLHTLPGIDPRIVLEGLCVFEPEQSSLDSMMSCKIVMDLAELFDLLVVELERAEDEQRLSVLLRQRGIPQLNP